MTAAPEYLNAIARSMQSVAILKRETVKVIRIKRK